MKTALISGISGQDGSYLAEFLLQKDYRVVGLDHPESTVTYEYLDPIRSSIELVSADLQDQESLEAVLEVYHPHEIYNLAGISFPPISWEKPILTAEVTGVGVARFLEAVRRVCPQARFYQASSSEMFGDVKVSPQDENTPFMPRNPYGAAKLYAYWMVVNYRKQHRMFAASGIMYNHESPRRGLEYVTRKITHAAVQIKKGKLDRLALGNLDARRDWGFAGDYVRAMWLMLNHTEADDFIIGSGETHTVREFCELAFGMLGLDYKDYVIVDERFYRPLEEYPLVANPKKAFRVLGWQPQVSFKSLVELMVEAEWKMSEEETEAR